ncbi:MAG: SRPBCC domain-containing protein [Candidatus Omnitrophica bacterium]|nr:SRPBCC domain-containing protein [Candidatus Omnitrophota bacterium]
MAKTTETKTQELIITRIFDAPRELVWKAWTKPDRVMRWWGPKIFKSPSCKIDFRVGGKYLFCMRSDIGEKAWKKGIWSTGVYNEIVPMEKIVCTDCFADEHGNVVSAAHYGMTGDFPLEMLVTVTFSAEGGSASGGEKSREKTKMTLQHTGLPAEMKEDCKTGWNESFDKLAESLK